MPRELALSRTSAPAPGDYSAAIRTYLQEKAAWKVAPRAAEVRKAE